MTNNRPPLLKRQLMVDQKIQVPLLTYALCMATVGVVSATVFSVVWARVMLNPNPNWLGPAILVFGGIFSYAVMIVFGLFITNRVAGPLHRLKMHMRDVVDGKDPGPLTNRKEDYIASDFIEDYNKIISMLKKG